MSEKHIEKSIIQYISRIGGWCTKVQSGKLCIGGDRNGGRNRYLHMAEAGTPDILACIKGKFVAIEVKKDLEEVRKWFRYPLGKRGQKLKPNKRMEAQKRQREGILYADGIHIVCASIEELQSDLRHLKLY